MEKNSSPRDITDDNMIFYALLLGHQEYEFLPIKFALDFSNKDLDRLNIFHSSGI